MEIQGKKSSADSGKNAELNSGNRKGKFREKSDSGFAEKKTADSGKKGGRVRGKKGQRIRETKSGGFRRPCLAADLGPSADRALPPWFRDASLSYDVLVRETWISLNVRFFSLNPAFEISLNLVPLVSLNLQFFSLNHLFVFPEPAPLIFP